MRVWLAAALMVATLPGRTHGLGLITEPLLADLRLDRVAYANLNLWATLLGALFCFPAGAAIDRAGVRWTSAALCLLLAASTGGISRFAGSMTVLFVLLLGTRAFGQSALSVAAIAVVGKSSPSRPGVAMGAFAILLSVGFTVAFGLVGWSVRAQGWRAAWGQVALAVALMAPLALWFVRAPRATGSREEVVKSSGHTLLAALKTPAFWVFAGAAALFNLVSSGLGLFNEAVLAERGFDRGTYHAFLVVTTLLSLGGQFLCGWLTTRWSVGRLTAVSLLLYAAGLGAIPYVTQPFHLWLAALLLGLSGGAIVVLFFTVWPVAFGRAHLGQILGAAQVCTVLASAVGPLVFAKCHDATGSYAPALGALAALVLANAMAAWRLALPRPGQPAQSTGDDIRRPGPCPCWSR